MNSKQLNTPSRRSWRDRITYAASGIASLLLCTLWIDAQRATNQLIFYDWEHPYRTFDYGSLSFNALSDSLAIERFVYRDSAKDEIDAAAKGSWRWSFLRLGYASETDMIQNTSAPGGPLPGESAVERKAFGFIYYNMVDETNPTIRTKIERWGMPWWFLITLVSSPWLITVTTDSRRWIIHRTRSRRLAAGLCPKCSYNRTGLGETDPCPECGTERGTERGTNLS